MRPLRQQVDRIDQKILSLLQQRNEVSRRIGETKRRHGAAIYVPERERALLERLLVASEGDLPGRAVQAIYREIISASRAEQGQAPIGVLKTNLASLLLPGRWRFGACDAFVEVKNWPALAAGLLDGKLALGLLTGRDLAKVLGTARGRREFVAKFWIADDFPVSPRGKKGLEDRIFVVIPVGQGPAETFNRLVILMECKSTLNTVKKLLRSMTLPPAQIDLLPLRSPAGGKSDAVLCTVLLRKALFADPSVLVLPAMVEGVSFLGAHLESEIYGG